MKKILVLMLLALAGLVSTPVRAQQVQLPASVSPTARQGGTFYASAYATWGARVVSGNSTTGSGTSIIITLPGPLEDNTSSAGNVLLNSGTLNPIRVNDNNAETVTPTSISFGTCPSGNIGFGSQNCATITGTFNNTHGAGAAPNVISGTYGLQEAINVAAAVGGGLVVVDSAWSGMGGTNAMLTAAIPYQSVFIEDLRTAAPLYWSMQEGATVLATPTTLTAVTALPSAAPVGAFGTGTYHMCIAYVDAMGQEGTCSADFSQAGLATGSFIFSPPAASTGAVGYTIYIGLTSGGVTNLDYKVPLVTQPTVVGVYPVANGVCTLTTVELTTPACAIVNATYGQATGATATVTAITLNTSPINPQSTVVSTTSIYVPNPGGRTTFVYTPGSHMGTPGLPAASLAFPLTTALATVVPGVAGTVNIYPGFMNYLGRTLEVCGEITGTASAATIVDIQFQWDAFGQNTAGKGVLIGDLTATPAAAIATAGHATFCQDFQTTVTSASATGGSINHIGGGGSVSGVSLIAGGALGDAVTPGAIGSLNLANEARINVIYLHTTATDGAGWILQSLTAKVVN
jgi:hypothetical protein